MSIMSLGFSQGWKQFTGDPLIWKIVPVAISSKGANATTFFTYRLSQEGLLLMIFFLTDLFGRFFHRKELSQSWVLAEVSKSQLCGTAPGCGS